MKTVIIEEVGDNPAVVAALTLILADPSTEYPVEVYQDGERITRCDNSTELEAFVQGWIEGSGDEIVND